MKALLDDLDNVFRDVVLHYYRKGIWMVPLCPPTLQVGDRYMTPWGSRVVRNDNQIGKAPFVAKWQKERIPLDKLLSCFSEGSEHLPNLGVLTGKINNLVVVDVDYRNGGRTWYVQNKDQLGGCLVEHTGNGLHLYYRFPDWTDEVPNVGDLAPGVEIKSCGSQVVTYPSIHRNGNLYHFEHGLELVDGE